MKRWSDFAAEKPEMAQAEHALIYQYRVGLGYLASHCPERRRPSCPSGLSGHRT